MWYTPKLFSPDPAERLANKRSPYLRRRHVSSADTLQRALETADQYTKRIFPGDPAKCVQPDKVLTAGSCTDEHPGDYARLARSRPTCCASSKVSNLMRRM